MNIEDEVVCKPHGTSSCYYCGPALGKIASTCNTCKRASWTHDFMKHGCAKCETGIYARPKEVYGRSPAVPALDAVNAANPKKYTISEIADAVKDIAVQRITDSYEMQTTGSLGASADLGALRADSEAQQKKWDDAMAERNKPDMTKESVKLDNGKLRYDLVPPEALEALATIIGVGAAKYAPRNWELGMDWGRYFAATMRHLWAWWGGEAKDPETGHSHLWHALCCIAFLVCYEKRKVGKDDRFIKS